MTSLLMVGAMIFALAVPAFAETKEAAEGVEQAIPVNSDQVNEDTTQPAEIQQPGETTQPEIGQPEQPVEPGQSDPPVAGGGEVVTPPLEDPPVVEPGGTTQPGDIQQPGETTQPEIGQPEQPVDPGQTAPPATGGGGVVTPPGEESPVVEPPVIEPPAVEPPVIQPPIVPPVIPDIPVKAHAPQPFRFVGSGTVQVNLNASTPTTLQLLNVTGIPASVKMVVYLADDKVAEIIAGKLTWSKEFVISGSQQLEFEVSGYGDLSRANINFTVVE